MRGGRFFTPLATDGAGDSTVAHSTTEAAHSTTEAAHSTTQADAYIVHAQTLAWRGRAGCPTVMPVIHGTKQYSGIQPSRGVTDNGR